MKQKDIEIIQSKIFMIRGLKVMLDKDLSEMYGVETRSLNQSVKRNLNRFPDDFMFQLTDDEFDNLKSQIVTSSWGGSRKPPFAFTQNGIAMLSSVLTSDKAVDVNIRIMRVFVKAGSLLQDQTELLKKIEAIEKQGLNNADQISMIFGAIKELYGYQEKEKVKKVGFKQE